MPALRMGEQTKLRDVRLPNERDKFVGGFGAVGMAHPSCIAEVIVVGIPSASGIAQINDAVIVNIAVDLGNKVKILGGTALPNFTVVPRF